VLIAKASPATAKEDDPVSVPQQFRRFFLGIFPVNNGSFGHPEDSIFAVTSMSLGTHARLSGCCPGVGDKFVVHKISNVAITEKDNVATIATIATVRPPLWDVLFPAKAETAMAAIACPQGHFNFIHEHDSPPQRAKKNELLLLRGQPIEDSVDAQLMYLPPIEVKVQLWELANANASGKETLQLPSPAVQKFQTRGLSAVGVSRKKYLRTV
jgi:hypothetical protein